MTKVVRPNVKSPDGTKTYEYDYKHLQVDSATHQLVKEISKQTGMNMSAIVRNAIREKFNK